MEGFGAYNLESLTGESHVSFLVVTRSIELSFFIFNLIFNESEFVV